MDEYPYVFAWRNNPQRARLYGRRCRVIARGSHNTVALEFSDGYRVTTSGNALRKANTPQGVKIVEKAIALRAEMLAEMSRDGNGRAG